MFLTDFRFLRADEGIAFLFLDSFDPQRGKDEQLAPRGRNQFQRGFEGL